MTAIFIAKPYTAKAVGVRRKMATALEESRIAFDTRRLAIINEESMSCKEAMQRAQK